MVDRRRARGDEGEEVVGGEGTERAFPMLITGEERRRHAGVAFPRYVPWMLLAPHEEWARNNHSQTLERLAERGGLGPDEMMAILEHRRWRSMPMLDALAQVEAEVARYRLGVAGVGP